MTFNIDIARDGYSKRQNTEDGPIDVWVDFFTVMATSPRGDVWALADSSSEDEAKVREALAALDHNPDTAPDKWLPCDPIYGSDAWDSEAEYNLACFEADAFNEPRPRW